MHESIELLAEIRPLRDPVLIAAFGGWTDAHGVAAAAVDYLVEQWDGKPLAQIDPEPYYDFTVERPHVRSEGDTRVIDWPRALFSVARPPGMDREFLLFSGAEPHLRWRQFTDAMIEVMQAAGVTTSITLGAQPSGVPHTRPLPVTLSASDDAFEEQFGLRIPTSRYEGPTGILSVLNLRLRALGWRNASLWALQPHYLNVGPNPQAILSLVRTIDRGFGVTTRREALTAQIAEFAAQVEDALDPSSEAATYVNSLEEQYDASPPPGAPDEAPGGGGTARSTPLPPSDEILGDLERFLREQRGEGGAGR